MRFFSFFLGLGLALAMSLGLSAQSVRVVFVSGQAELQRPNENAPRAVVKGETVVIGTRIVTGQNGRVVLTPLPGVQSIITPNTTLVLESVAENRTSAAEVTHQAVLDLKEGAVVSDLQRPEGVTYDYSIRTARGLAGARGTTYTVGINAAGIQTVIVSEGSITLRFADGTQATLASGRLTLTDASGNTKEVGSIGELSPEEQAIVQSVAEASIAALANALEAGVGIDQQALEDALDTTEALGIVLPPDLRALVDRVLTLIAIRPPAGSDIDNQTVSEVIAKIEADKEEEEDTPPPITGFPSLQAFFASLSPTQQEAFEEILDIGFNSQGETLLTSRLQEQQFAADVVEVINLYVTLDSDSRAVLPILGILGDNNIAAVGADITGLGTLIDAYGYLNYLEGGELMIYPAHEGDYGVGRSTFTNITDSHTFFAGNTGTAGHTIYNVVFGDDQSSSTLTTVGATRVLSINNEERGELSTFIGGYNETEPNHRVELRAADEVSLAHVRFGSNISSVLIAAATINLANVKFEDGSYVGLYSKYGSANFNGSSQFGKVNFITNVKYGDTLLTEGNFGDGVRGENDVTGGRVHIGTLQPNTITDGQ